MDYNTGATAGPKKVERPAVTYVCGECGIDNDIKAREPIRCKNCGYRIMYKKRTNDIVQFDAR